MRSVWELVAERFSAYQLTLPGSPTFICQPHTCDAQCCRRFSVNLGEAEVDRFAKASGLQLIEFLECEEGKPIALPIAQPYLLARGDGACKQLGSDLGCGQYQGRPNACRLYPHFILFIDPETARPVHGDEPGMSRSYAAALAGEEPAPYVPLLLRHVDCPGFTGAPMSDADWAALFADTYLLQYPGLA